MATGFIAQPTASFDPGFVDSPPTSTISDPDLIIFILLKFFL